MSTNPYSPPKANLDILPASADTPALWNPGVAGVLAFFLTPIFGALILMKNWQAMGEPDKAGQAKMWAIGTLVFYVVLMLSAFFIPENGALNLLSRVAGLGFFIAWYMMSCKDQKDVVAYRYGTNFIKRGWTKPALYAVGVYLAAVVVFIGFIAVFVNDA